LVVVEDAVEAVLDLLAALVTELPVDPPVVVVAPETGVEPPTAAVVAATDSEAVPFKQSVLPGRMVNGAEPPVRPRESRITSVHDVPSGRLAFQVIASAEVVPTVTRGAAAGCPPGWTVITNGGDEPEKVSWMGRHSWTPEGVLIAGSGVPAALVVAAAAEVVTAAAALVDCPRTPTAAARATKTFASIIVG